MSRPVSRLEIAEAVRPAFEGGGADRNDILQAAEDSQTRPEVLEALARLDDRRYTRLNEIWENLTEIPVEV